MIALLVATLAAFGLWYVELRPSSSAAGGGSQGVGSYQSAINQAHQAVKTSNAANARLGAPTSTGVAPNSPTAVKTAAPAKTASTEQTASAGRTASVAKHASTAKPASKPASKTASKTAVKTAKPVAKTNTALSTTQQVSLIESAIQAHKVVAVLFYNGAASDDVAMDHELASVPTHGRQVVKLGVPLSELTSFAVITEQVPVVTAPTLVVIDASRRATTLTGYADPLVISQTIADALAAK